MRRVRTAAPADLVLLFVLTFALGADVPLLRNGHASVSERAGFTWRRKAIVAYLALHLLRVVPREFDPLCRVGGLLRPPPPRRHCLDRGSGYPELRRQGSHGLRGATSTDLSGLVHSQLRHP